MATVEHDAGPGGSTSPGSCANAAEYVIQRLQGAEEPVSPGRVATEYGCTQSHMRQTFADLADDGVIERVGHGEYVHRDTYDNVGSDASDVGSNVESDEEISEEETEEMPTQAEYEQQYSDEESAFSVTDSDTDQDGDAESEEIVGEEGSDEIEESDSGGGSPSVATAGAAGAAAAAPSLISGGGLSKGQKQALLFLVVALALWFAYDRLAGGVDSDVEVSELEDDGDDQGGGDSGGLIQ